MLSLLNYLFKEIDECATNNGGCQYECINFEGGYECTCPDGMFLASDGLSCVIKCYTCIDAESNEECVDLVVSLLLLLSCCSCNKLLFIDLSTQ